MEQKRADLALTEAGIAESRTKAAALIKEGLVMADGKPIEKPSQPVSSDAVFTLSATLPSDVSRAGQKLRAALEAFGTDVRGKVFADIGASTGGFTQCLLENGASLVYAVDVGRDQLHSSLRGDSRVVVMEGTNARTLTAEDFDQKLNGAVMDVSFISQTLIYPSLSSMLPAGAPLITLVKPQFEVGRENIGKNGIVKDKKGTLLQALMQKIKLAAEENGFDLLQTTVSPIKGSKGNTEYLAYFIKR